MELTWCLARTRPSGLCTTNMERSITEARLPWEIAQSSAPVSIAYSTRAAGRIVPPRGESSPPSRTRRACDFFSVLSLSVLWDFCDRGRFTRTWGHVDATVHPRQDKFPKIGQLSDSHEVKWSPATVTAYAVRGGASLVSLCTLHSRGQ